MKKTLFLLLLLIPIIGISQYQKGTLLKLDTNYYKPSGSWYQVILHTDNKLYYWNGSYWNSIGQNTWLLSGVNISNTNSGKVSINNAAFDSTFNVNGSGNFTSNLLVGGIRISPGNNSANGGLSIGNSVGPDLTSTALQNHLIGRLAGTNLTTGNQNTVLGYAAMYQSTTAYQNIAIGHNALRGHNTGHSNIAIGYETMYNVALTAVGVRNNAIGRVALRNTTSGSNNQALGYAALGLTTTGSNNIGIGESAGNNITSGAYNIIIGNVNAASATDSSQLNIGGWITGKAGSIAIGTYTEPSIKLDIQSTTQGFLMPRMTTAQRNAIVSPATWLTLICTDCTATDASTGVMQIWNGSTWKNAW